MSIERIPIATIDRVEGRFFTFTREYSTGLRTFQGLVGIPVYLGDIIETDIHTSVEILFHIGGVTDVFPGEKVEVKGHREIVVIDVDPAIRHQSAKDLIKPSFELITDIIGTNKRRQGNYKKRAGGVIGGRG